MGAARKKARERREEGAGCEEEGEGMILARSAMKKEKEKKDGDVAGGPPKKKKQRVMTDGELERLVYYYVRGRADASGMPQPQPPRESPPSHILEARRFASGQ